MMVLLVLWVLLVIYLFHFVNSCCTSCCKQDRMTLLKDHTSLKNQAIDENLAPYYQNINGLKQKEIYASEVHMRHRLAIRTQFEHPLEMLRTAKRGDKEFQGLPNYQILSNLNYCTDFQYQSMEMRNDQDDFEISDVITRVLHVSPIHYYDGGQKNDCGQHKVKISTNPGVLKSKLKHDKALLKARHRSTCPSRASQHSFATAKDQEVANAAPAAHKQQPCYDYEYADIRSSLIQQEPTDLATEDGYQQNKNYGYGAY